MSGRLEEAYRDRFPRLFRLLETPAVANAFLSSLDPGMHIPAHRGYFKGYLRYHLPIEVPDDHPKGNPAHIVCGGVRHNWKTGRGILFDDMFLHWVYNTSPTQRRTVLYLARLASLRLPIAVDVRRRSQQLPWLGPVTDGMYNVIHSNPSVYLAIADQHRQRQVP